MSHKLTINYVGTSFNANNVTSSMRYDTDEGSYFSYTRSIEKADRVSHEEHTINMHDVLNIEIRDMVSGIVTVIPGIIRHFNITPSQHEMKRIDNVLKNEAEIAEQRALKKEKLATNFSKKIEAKKLRQKEEFLTRAGLTVAEVDTIKSNRTGKRRATTKPA